MLKLPVLEQIKSEGHFMIVGPKKGKILALEVKKKEPKRILEVGTYVGYSSILMVDAASKTKIITLEVDPEFAEIARENIEKAGFNCLQSRIYTRITKILCWNILGEK